MRQISYILLILITLFSCKKKEIITSEASAYAECDTYTKMTESAVVSKLAGSWTWARRSCYQNPQVAADKNTIVTFNTNATFSVLEDGNIITQGTWKVKIIDDKVWGLDLSNESEYLNGYILFCKGNEVSFDDSRYDACIYTFIRK